MTNGSVEHGEKGLMVGPVVDGSWCGDDAALSSRRTKKEDSTKQMMAVKQQASTTQNSALHLRSIVRLVRCW